MKLRWPNCRQIDRSPTWPCSALARRCDANYTLDVDGLLEAVNVSPFRRLEDETRLDCHGRRRAGRNGVRRGRHRSLAEHPGVPGGQRRRLRWGAVDRLGYEREPLRHDPQWRHDHVSVEPSWPELAAGDDGRSEQR